MDIAVLGIKYCDETAKLIKDNCKDVNINSINLTEDWILESYADIYIITDRLCDGIKLKPDICIKTLDNLMKNIRQSDIAIINFDDDNLIRHLMGLNCNIITYGYNSKSSVTISGFEEDIFTGQASYVCSLQRTLTTIEKSTIEPCEIKLSVSGQYNSQSIIAYSAFLLSANLI